MEVVAHFFCNCKTPGCHGESCILQVASSISILTRSPICLRAMSFRARMQSLRTLDACKPHEYGLFAFWQQALSCKHARADRRGRGAYYLPPACKKSCGARMQLNGGAEIAAASARKSMCQHAWLLPRCDLTARRRLAAAMMPAPAAGPGAGHGRAAAKRCPDARVAL